MRSRHGTQHCQHTQGQQHLVHPMKPCKSGFTIPCGLLSEPLMQKQRFENEQYNRKDYPDECHQMHPPELQMAWTFRLFSPIVSNQLQNKGGQLGLDSQQPLNWVRMP